MATTRRRPEKLYRRPDQPGGTWYMDYYDDAGRRIRRSLKTDSLAEAKEARDKILRGEVTFRWARRDRDIDLAEFWRIYEAWAKDHKSKLTLDRERICFEQFRAALPKRKTLGEVTPPDVDTFKHYLRTRRKATFRGGKQRTVPAQGNSTVNDNLRRMQTLYTWAQKRPEIYARGNPFEGFDRLPVEKTPPKFLTAEQITRMTEAAQEHGRDVYLFCALAVYAGLRTAEAIAATWQWVDFDHGTITVQASGTFRTKSKRFRTVPLHDKLREILEHHRAEAGFIIAPQKTEPGKWRLRYAPGRAFDNVVRTAGIEWASPHTLRHTFASRLVQEGVSLYKVSVWLGHSKVETTAIYAHLMPRDEDINRF